jgi:type I restriction enzyme R subunit
MITGINSEDRLVQKTVADHLHHDLGWESVYAWNEETFGPNGTLGRTNEREVVLVRDLRAALIRLNPDLPADAIESAIQALITYDYSRSLLQHNQDFYRFIRDGVPVNYRDNQDIIRKTHVRVIDFRNGRGSDGSPNNRFLVVRELKIQGIRVPYYNRRADLVCFVNGLPLVFIELKAVYRNIRRGFDDNLTDYMTEQVISHAFYHNAFLIVSNGDRARYGSITSKWEHFAEWKRNDEKEKGRVDAETLLNAMLHPVCLLDLVENFILFDDSKSGGTRKIVARNHQVLGVNRAIDSVKKQEDLKKQFPERERLRFIIPEKFPEPSICDMDPSCAPIISDPEVLKKFKLPLIERAHPDLGRLGVFWHTQGSGKSYSMAFFTEKVRRVVPGSHTFVLMTDRDDLDDQIFKTFRGIGIANDKTPRANSGKELEKLLTENHRYLFTLIQKFRRDEPPKKPYSLRDDIIVISDEAHRTQGGKLARNMRLALPNASFIGFTGTPLFKYDQITRRIFGNYISRYDFKRSEEDGSTVRLVYDSRGEKLGIARIDLNDRIAAKIEEAELDPDQVTKLEKLLGRDYEVITADDRLDKLADDFVEYCSTRWESGKSLLVCIDKVTCGRMYQRIIPRWGRKIDLLKNVLASLECGVEPATNEEREKLANNLINLRSKIRWMETTNIAIIISEAQNEVRDFARWDVDIVPHRNLIKQGFETPDGKRLDVETAFKDPEHPFRIAIVCAMWLTGFDVECLSTLYIDKPMKAHTLMQAIARANRIYPGKDCGVIVDYNGVLPSLRQALAEYALGDDGENENLGEVVTPIEDLVTSLQQAIDQTEGHLRGLGFEPTRLIGTKGFDRIQALRDAVDVLYTSDEVKRRFEIQARIVFSRFKALIIEPSSYQFAERHDNIEAIYKKLEENRDTADITDILKEIHKIVNEAIRTQGNESEPPERAIIDLSSIDFEKLREEFSTKVQRKHIVIQNIREVVERKLQQMLANNPQRMDYYKKYQEIIADYNREKDRSTIEDTFVRLADLVRSLDEEQQRHVKEGLSESELALFDLLNKDKISQTERERVKLASRSLLDSLKKLLKTMELWTKNPQTQAEVEVFILDKLYETLPMPPFTEEECTGAAHRVYEFIWQRCASGSV